MCSVTENLLSEGNDTALLFVNKETTKKMKDTIDTEVTSKLEENGHIGFVNGQADMNRCLVLGHLFCHQAVASQSGLKSEVVLPSEVLVGEDVRICLETKDAAGNAVVAGGAAVSAKLCSPSGEVGIARVKDNEDGTYDIVFRSNCKGRHRLSVAVFGRQVTGSPFDIAVVKTARRVLEFGAGGCITKLREPWGVAVSRRNGDVFVADTGNNCIRIFDLNGNHRKQLNFPNFPSKFEPLGLTLVGDEENILVTDHINKQVCTNILFIICLSFNLILTKELRLGSGWRGGIFPHIPPLGPWFESHRDNTCDWFSVHSFSTINVPVVTRTCVIIKARHLLRPSGGA